ncbi:MAG: TRAP transporter large permease subunit, partial [Gammaproteobacteria bacterium]|nr:TRAP transporter large permease subunit [Gammaproteobacteria bacterium]
MKKELRFGFALMAIILVAIAVFMPWSNLTNGHLGLLMLALIVVAIMLGFPTAFTLMGMGVFFAWLSYSSVDPSLAVQQTLDLMVQRAYSVMTNDVLIAIPLFVFMGYIVERANLIAKLFKSIHLAMADVPGSLAVATLVTCAIFATATGIIGAVVTLMGLLALPAMLRAGYDVRLSAGCITAGGCLGILIPPSVLLIVYGATAGVSVVQLYAGAFFPGLMLTALYIGYVILRAKLNPALAPPLSEADRHIPLPEFAEKISAAISKNVIPGLLAAFKGRVNAGISTGSIARQMVIVILPALVWFGGMGLMYKSFTAPLEIDDTSGLVEMGVPEADSGMTSFAESADDGVKEPSAGGVQEPPGSEKEVVAPTIKSDMPEAPATPPATGERRDAPLPFLIIFAVGTLMLVALYRKFTFARLEVFKMLLGSFFPLAVMILSVLGSIVFGLATPTEAAAVGALGGIVLAWAYRQLNF